MLLVLITLLSGYATKTVQTKEQSCEISDMRVLMVTVKQLRAEIRQNEEETTALKKELLDLKHWRLETTLLQKQTEALETRLSETEVTANEMSITLHTRVSEMNISLSELKQYVESIVNETHEKHTQIEAFLSKLNMSINRLTDLKDSQTVELNETLTDLVTRLEDTTTQIEQKLNIIANFTKTQTNELNATTTSLNNGIVALMNQFNITLQNHTTAIEQLQDVKAVNTNAAVGFVARSSESAFYCNGTLPFETLIFDKGGVFNKNTGFFTAPYSGTYFFSTQVCRSLNAEMYISIASLTRGVLSKFVGYTCDSVPTVAYLSKGEEVFVNCTKPNSISTNDTLYWTMFNGALLQLQ